MAKQPKAPIAGLSANVLLGAQRTSLKGQQGGLVIGEDCGFTPRDLPYLNIARRVDAHSTGVPEDNETDPNIKQKLNRKGNL